MSGRVRAKTNDDVTAVPAPHVVEQFFRALLPPALTGAALALAAVMLGPSSVLFAMLLNAFVMSQIAGSLQVKSIAFAPGYYRLRLLERDGRIYERVGILLFKRLMVSKAYRRLNPAFTYDRRRQTPEDLLIMMRSAEAAHAVGFAIMLFCSILAISLGSVSAALWIFVFNVIGNGYPVMLQRYNRGRVQRVYGTTARIPKAG